MLKYLNSYVSILKKDPAFRNSFVKNVLFLSAKKFRNSVSPGKSELVIINLSEHMGDIIAAEPISRHLRSLYPAATLIWCVNNRFTELVRYNPALNGLLSVTCIAEWILIKKLFSPWIRMVDLLPDGRSCGTYKLTNRNKSKSGLSVFNYLEQHNLLQAFADAGGLTEVEDETPLFHFSGNEKDEVVFHFEYIVLHTLANDPQRNWSPEQWNLLLSRLLDSYPDLHVVEIGLESILHNSSPRFHNIANKYNLQQIAHIIKRSVLFIGVESGFAHFANALGTSSIVLIGHYQHYRNYQVYSGRFATGEGVSLHYHPGQLKHLDMENVWPKVESRLDNLRNSRLMRI